VTQWNESANLQTKILLIWFDSVTFVETDYLNTDMYKSESSKRRENRVQSGDSLKTCSKPTAFIELIILKHKQQILQTHGWGGKISSAPVNTLGRPA